MSAPLDGSRGSDWSRVRRLFEETVELEEPQRGAFLEHACAGDAKLQAQVEELLASDRGDDGFLQPAGTSPLEQLCSAAFVPRAGEYIGAFRLVRLVASGGMGHVFEAVQEEPHRRVALKVLRWGLGSESARRRFRYETEVLAKLRHPAIAAIHQVGIHVADTGAGSVEVPYFVMEFVEDALDVVSFAEHNALDRTARIELVQQACDALHHGHQRGVIHRDVKPANLLVDGSGRLRVIDFGVARALVRDEDSTRGLTEAGEVIGTLRYMSPEQVTGDPFGIDTRCDVYALGGVLYELLSGRPPHALENLPLLEAARRVRDETVASLSTVSPELAGDLERVVAKALERDPERRYGSARELADDLGRYLAHRPVSAGPPSRIYELHKFLRRHRLGMSVAAVVVLALSGGGVGLGVGYVEAHDALGREQVARTAEAKQRRKAESQEQAARLEAEKLRAVLAFLEQTLGAPSSRVEGRQVRVVDVLDDAARAVDDSFGEHPEVAARVEETLGRVYSALGLLEPAERTLAAALERRRAALGEDALETLATQLQLASVLIDADRLERADRLVSQARARLLAVHGTEHPLTLLAGFLRAHLLRRQEEWEPALKLHRKVLEARRRVLPREDDDITASLCSLASSLMHKGERREGLALAREAFERSNEFHGPNHPATAKVRGTLTEALLGVGELTEAKAVLTESVAVLREQLGPLHGETIDRECLLGTTLYEMGHFEELVELLRVTLANAREGLGPEHRLTLRVARLLALGLDSAGRTEEAQRLRDEVLAILATSEGGPSELALTTRADEALALLYERHFEEARAILEEVLASAWLVWPETHPRVFALRANLGGALIGLAKYEEAQVHIEAALAGFRAQYGPKHASVLLQENALASVLIERGLFAESEALIRRTREIAEESLAPEHLYYVIFAITHGSVLLQLDRYEEAEDLLLYARDELIAHPLEGRSYARVVAERLQELELLRASAEGEE